ncbi:hypothetical protein VDG1235_1837 [Verrucomicrobiia bacterium DG1235]|nr:hypothetical protein VDG1235_1837 [Verrucomicrobiae bacterium DG1235]
MNPFNVLLLSFALASAAFAADPIKVLYFTKSSGWEHSVVKWGPNGEPSYSEKVLTGLGEKEGFAFTYSKDGSLFSAEYLESFDVVFFYTSGSLHKVGTDGQPAITAAGKQALLDWVERGGGFMAVHAASDSYHTYESFDGNTPKDKRGHRYEYHGEASDPYIKMLGGEFINHGSQQEAAATVVDPEFPGMEGLGAEIRVMEEWYSLKEYASDNHVLMVMQTEGMEETPYERPDYPLSWARPFGEGRVYYNAMGHREDVWDSAYFQAMLAGGIRWTAGELEADVEPNLLEAAPGAMALPPQ